MIIKIRSKRLDTELEVEAYQKDDVLIIRHTSLENIFWGMPDAKRPEMEVDTVDLARTPGIPPMFAVKCKLKDPASGCVFEQFGEMLCANWQMASKITRDFPLTMCKNQAFDRAFVRYLQLDISGKAIALYSDSEIEIPQNMPVYGNGADMDPLPAEPGLPVTPDTMPQGQDMPAAIPDAIGFETGQETAATNEGSQVQPSIPEQAARPLPPPVYPENNPVPEDGPDDVWAGMNVDETMAAYGYGQPLPFGGFDVPDNVMPAGAPSPFPWGPQAANEQAPMPDMLQMPEYTAGSMDAVPAAPNGTAANALSVYEAGFDFSLGKTAVRTNAGTVYYDPFSQTWETSEFDLSAVDLDDLYQKTSMLLGENLKDYNGPSLP